MSDAFYNEIQGIADDLLEEFQQGTVTLTRTIEGAPDPATPWIPGLPTATTYTLKAIARGVGKQHIDGTLILASDLIVQCSTKTVDNVAIVPTLRDTLRIDGIPHTIKKIVAEPAAGIPAYFEIFVAG